MELYEFKKIVKEQVLPLVQDYLNENDVKGAYEFLKREPRHDRLDNGDFYWFHYLFAALIYYTAPDHVLDIGPFIPAGTFYNLAVPEGFKIPKGVTSIQYTAFEYCPNLTSIDIPEGVQIIGKEAFSSCESLTQVSIPDTVKTIEAWTFSHCESLTKIKLPSSIGELPWGIFQGCTSLTTVDIPEGVKILRGRAFDYCTSLSHLVLPDTLTQIESNAFCKCISLTSLTIPEGVTKIQDGAFSGNHKLKVRFSKNTTLKVDDWHLRYWGLKKDQVEWY